MNHKRHRPKNRRSGCLMCKPWKVNGYSIKRNDGEQFSSHKSRINTEKDLKDYKGNGHRDHLSLANLD